MSRDVDLRPAIQAAAEALGETIVGDLCSWTLVEQVAEKAVRAAAQVLGLTDLGAIPDTRVCQPEPQSMVTAALLRAHIEDAQSRTDRLLDDVKANRPGVVAGYGMSLDHDHAQAVIDALVGLAEMRS